MTTFCGVRRGAVHEVDYPVNPLVGAAPLLRLGLGLQQGDGPELELVGVLLPQGAGAAHVPGFAHHRVVGAGVQVEGRLEAAFHQGHGQVGNVNAQPLPVELMRRRHRRPAAAEGVKHHVSLVVELLQLRDLLRKFRYSG